MNAIYHTKIVLPDGLTIMVVLFFLFRTLFRLDCRFEQAEDGTRTTLTRQLNTELPRCWILLRIDENQPVPGSFVCNLTGGGIITSLSLMHGLRVDPVRARVIRVQ